MNDLTNYFVAGFATLACAAITYFGLRVFSTKTQRINLLKDTEIFPQLELPNSVAARYELLKNDPDGVVLEKVKLAARMKIDRPQEFFAALWLRTAGVNSEESLQVWRMRLLRNLSIAAIASLALGLIKGLAAAALLAPIVFAIGAAQVLLALRRAANDRERAVTGSLRTICIELRTLLSAANDVVTCLGAIASKANQTINPDPVRTALSQALLQMRAGTAIDVALRDAARLIEVRHFSALCGYLIMVHSGSREWRRQLDELVAALDDQDKLIEQKKRRGISKRFPRQ